MRASLTLVSTRSLQGTPSSFHYQNPSENLRKFRIEKLANYLGIGAGHNGNGQDAHGGSKKRLDLSQLKRVDAANDSALIQMFCAGKAPITSHAVTLCRGVPHVWHGLRVIVFTAHKYPGAADDAPMATVLCRVEGTDFPAVGKLGARKTHLLGGSKEGWFCSGPADEVKQASTILKCEGITDWLAAVSAGLPPKWVAVTNAFGAKSAKKLDFTFAAGKDVVVLHDADTPGQDGAKNHATGFINAGAEVRIAQLPYPVEPDHGRDLRDWLNEGHTATELAALVEATEPVTAEQVAEWKRMRTDRAIIIIGTDESRVIDEAIAALATQENVYQRGGCLVQVVEGTDPPKGIARPKDAPRIGPMRHARMRELLASAAVWGRADDDGNVEIIHPPAWVVEAVDARGQWSGIRHLEAVVENPVLRADGTVLQTPGYDDATGIVLRQVGQFAPIPERPTLADAQRARDALLEVVSDFPFATEAHRAAWVAATITPLSRYAFHGPAPLFLIDANVRGCGKSLLADAAAAIVSGRDMARMVLPRDDDEFRKRITALAMAGEPLILLDNVAGRLGGSSLDAALTATSWSDRVLGKSEIASGIPLYATWFGTGNNVVLAADTARRTVHIRLASPEENPEERSGFNHPDLLAWIHVDRARLSAAAVTILAAYCAARRPNMGLVPWGSFEAWSALVRQALVWIGLPDPGATRTELSREADREAAALRQLIDGWEEIDPTGRGVTVAHAIQELADNPADYEAIRSALWELAPPKDGKTLNPHSIGMKLSHLRQRVVGGKYLDYRRDSTNVTAWRVVPAGSTGATGTKPNPFARAHAHARTRGR